MKKAMMFAAALLAAAATQAASLEWGADVSNSADADATAQAGTIVNLIYFGSETPGAATTYNKSTGLTDAGGTLIASHTLTADEAVNYTFCEMYTASADQINGNWMMTIFDPTTPTVFDSSTYVVSGVTETGQAGTIYDHTWTFGTNMGGTVVSGVPEPCSVALLLLGAAAFGLKRKRA